MIRLTWLQFRPQAVTAAAALAAVAVILAITGPYLVNTGTDGFLYAAAGVVLYLTPALIGIFWGAPLISSELESGTFRLAWTQSVSRTRWLAVKLGLAGLASLATAGLLSLMVTWWASPIDRLLPDGSRFTYQIFGARDLTPLGYAAFAFALGVTVGLLVRRTLPAIAITLAVFAAVQVAVPLWVRPHLFTPVRTVSALNPSAITSVGTFAAPGNNMDATASVNIPGAWVYSSQVTTPGGSTNLGPRPQACASGSYNACVSALARLHLRQVVTYQPASRYWAFQWTETGIYLLLALLLTGFCIWRVNRQLSR
jgi:ABC-type transport system involved in multi-copper enzyme maturation permease subunit